MDDKAVGEALRKAREEAEMSQGDVGEIVHLSRQSIGDREKGRTGYRLSEVLELQKQGIVSLRIFD